MVYLFYPGKTPKQSLASGTFGRLGTNQHSGCILHKLSVVELIATFLHHLTFGTYATCQCVDGHSEHAADNYNKAPLPLRSV